MVCTGDVESAVVYGREGITRKQIENKRERNDFEEFRRSWNGPSGTRYHNSAVGDFMSRRNRVRWLIPVDS